MNATKESPRATNRKTAIIVGVLYIIGTVAGILSLASTGPILEGPDYLTQVFTNPNQIVIGALLVLTMGLALAMVSMMMFPVLKRYNEALAVGYVLFRGALEAVIDLAVVIGWLSLPLISQKYIKASAAESFYFQALGDLVLEAHDQIGHVLTIVFILGALMFYYVLYQSKLVPRWLSSWGLLAAIPYFVSGVAGLFGLLSPMSTVQMVLVLPLALQEMVLAVWLIVKGFNSSSVNVRSAQAAISQA
ncbi:MAG TPA: DUF4386 domain-containing protein [Anaerolineales bacterium]|nr:DUF4386 domain-containing protein [Anaerolineales bacterium]